ncbi:MAG: UDP-N-acetylmuramoyl-L-alanine--D-glutamate ligase [Anaerosomatales bacterium]|nr:UDP-N-acetylmuramoyl-L-alanine--D-glutamate ligase [Anaerosomatales bacterium]
MNERSIPSGSYAVLGLGSSGEAVCRFLAKRIGAGVDRVVAYDAADTPELRERAKGLAELGVECVLGADAVTVPAEIVVASPGIRPDSALMQSALLTAAEVISEIELAYRASRSPWVAITGTNGKTTTTALVGHLLDCAGVACEVVGNIGRPAISVVEDAGPATVLVAEVSSFQLKSSFRFRPRVSVLFNITPDHIDYHGSFEAYAADKARIFSQQGPGDTAVIDVDDEGSAVYAPVAEGAGVSVVRVSARQPWAPGAYLRDSMLVVDLGPGPVELVSRDELRIKGSHNVSNALAAAAAALAAGADPAGVREGLRTFSPLPHRLEPVGVVDGVEYFNDSKATNPDSVLKALTAFDDRPLVLLLGGRNKGSSFVPVAEAASQRAKAVVVFGEAADEIAAAFDGFDGFRLLRAPGLAAAFEAARSVAEPGDAVLLSPGCASFDEFTGYDHRGWEFRRMVQDAGRSR